MASKKKEKTKKCNNICINLFHREINGSLRKHNHSLKQQIFPLIPARLCYKLGSLVSFDILEEGHVFLGFTRCGRYIVSYSCQVTPDEHIGLPRYTYALQWWRFVPNLPLSKIREVKLFGEDVDQSLYISFCEWPEDYSKILVFGYSLPSRNQDSCCQCYITVTSFYPTNSCGKCQALQQDKKVTGFPKRCIRHDFSVHTKYELTPPFPPFIPRIQLQVNGIAVINSGDSLIALQVSMGNNEELKNKQILGMTDVSNSCVNAETSWSDNSCKSKSNGCSFCMQDLDNRLIPNREKECLDDSQKENVQRCGVKDSLRQQRSPKSSIAERHLDFQGKSPKPGATDWLSDYQGRSPKSYADRDFQGRSPKSFSGDRTFDFQGRSPKPQPLEKGIDCQDFPKATLCDASSEEWFECLEDQPHGNKDINKSCSKPYPPSSADVCNVMSPKSENNTDIKNVMSPKSDNTSVPILSPKCDGSSYSNAKTSPLSKVENRSVPDGYCPACGNRLGPNYAGTVHAGRLSQNPGSDSAPGTPKANTNSSSGTPQNSKPGVGSCVSTPQCNSQRTFWSPSVSSGTSRSTDSQYLQINESRTVSFSVRTFAQTTSTSDHETTGTSEDDVDFAYRSVLPIEIALGNNIPVCLATASESSQDYLRITQLTFDVEHFLEEIIGRKASWGHRYVAFTNYDLQILEVCPESKSIIGTVFVLIHAREEVDNPKRKRSRHTVKLYQTSICFTWSMTTGSFDTEYMEPLTEVDEMDMRRHEWKPGYRECSLIRRQMYIPQSSQRYVNILTNESVFKDKSLSMIVSPHLRVAILLGN